MATLPLAHTSYAKAGGVDGFLTLSVTVAAHRLRANPRPQSQSRPSLAVPRPTDITAAVLADGTSPDFLHNLVVAVVVAMGGKVVADFSNRARVGSPATIQALARLERLPLALLQ